jgi:hypothetical protein
MGSTSSRLFNHKSSKSVAPSPTNRKNFAEFSGALEELPTHNNDDDDDDQQRDAETEKRVHNRGDRRPTTLRLCLFATQSTTEYRKRRRCVGRDET